MKKSEFLNKTKEELEEVLKELEKMADFYDEDDENIQMIKLFLTNEAILKSAAKDKEGREQLLVLAETTKGMVGVLKKVEEDEIEDDFDESDFLRVTLESALKGKERAKELEKDFEDDIQEEISEEDGLKSVLDDLSGSLGIDRDELEDMVQEEIAQATLENQLKAALFGSIDDEDDKDLN